MFFFNIARAAGREHTRSRRVKVDQANFFKLAAKSRATRASAVFALKIRVD
jgi:hypothetical protein